VLLDPQVEASVAELVPRLLEAVPGLPCPRWVAHRLLEGDERLEQALLSGELAALGVE
jgi:ferrous iron transport protein B